MPSFVSDIVRQSRHRWPAILSQAGIVVPANHRKAPAHRHSVNVPHSVRGSTAAAAAHPHASSGQV
ncbi:hypothetical protein PTE_01226 [Photorhabdus khanii NC19]|uniref:Uncharacterized protein n=1 Tax=Photorhabdus khanii NC19 TaxID=1004151 RepID=W3VBW3_9GAMM|nr:hypothetical protein [Photorhabdus khanii]ETS32590.1 hypothetical protein PTE_01226 [Photorhabdus khanii NC19]